MYFAFAIARYVAGKREREREREYDNLARSQELDGGVFDKERDIVDYVHKERSEIWRLGTVVRRIMVCLGYDCKWPM